MANLNPAGLGHAMRQIIPIHLEFPKKQSLKWSFKQPEVGGFHLQPSPIVSLISFAYLPSDLT